MPEAGLPESVTEDRFLDGTVVLRQPAVGYRAAIDPVLLAAAVDARAGDRVLEAGAGHGAAAICLARRVPDCRVTGIEMQPGLVKLANENARLNGLSGTVQVMVGDLVRPLPRIAAGTFDHVMANPPYLDAGRADRSDDPGRAAANVEGEATLKDWIAFMLRMVRARGTVTLIQRADRLDEILSLLHGRAGETVVFPLWPRSGVPAKRVIVRARKGIRSPLAISAGLVLHDGDGFSTTADAVLRGGGLNIFDSLSPSPPRDITPE